MPAVHFQSLIFIANDCLVNVPRLRAFLTEKGLYDMHFTYLLKVMKAVIYMLILASIFFA